MVSPQEPVLEEETSVTPLHIPDQVDETVPAIGTWDFSAPATQMASIDSALRTYFETASWVEARDKEFPGLYASLHPSYQRVRGQ
ncbi:MAG: hypothetical protein ACE5Q6_17605 [Dehalococcoidia bacterium]